jgi:hypothetical protein
VSGLHAFVFSDIASTRDTLFPAPRSTDNDKTRVMILTMMQRNFTVDKKYKRQKHKIHYENTIIKI